MNEDRLGVLIHGAGWVSTQHIAALQRNPHVEIRAVSSRSLASAVRRAEEAGSGGVAAYDDYQKALQHPGIDLVVICTPPAGLRPEGSGGNSYSSSPVSPPCSNNK